MATQVTYLDFDLQISKEGDRYMAQVRNSPAGESTRVPLQWPFDEKHDMLLLRLENAVLRAQDGFRSGSIISGEEKILREFGSEVFRAVFRDTPEVAELFARSLGKVKAPLEGLRLKLRLEPPELAALPWEYVFDASSRKDSFLCLKKESPLVRFLDGAVTNKPLDVDGPLRILAMIANPGGDQWALLDTENERHAIDEALKDVPNDVLHFRWVNGGTPDDLFNVMQKGPWHIFHFIGHGGTDHYLDSDGSTRTEGYVVMQDGVGGAVKVSASALGLILGDGDVHLGVLNCCDSGSGSGFSSAGAALVKAGIPMAIAMQFPISNDAASRFSGKFFESLASGESIEKALTVARRFMWLKSKLEWGIPVLFTQAGPYVLFGPEAVARTAEILAQAGPPGAPLAAVELAPTATPAARAPSADEVRLSQAQEKLRQLWERA